MNVLSAAELYTEMANIVNFVMHFITIKKSSSNALKTKPKVYSKMLKKKKKWLTFKYQKKPNRAKLGKYYPYN